MIVKAKDYAGNERTNAYEVSVSGSSKAFTYDANGNMTGDGTRTFEWDARNQLLSITVGTSRTEFTYDGLNRRVRWIEKENGVTQSDTDLLWCEWEICEERSSDGTTVLRRAFQHGEQVGGAARFFSTDHLETVTEVTDSAGDLLSRYTYDPWGRRTLTTGTDLTSAGFTGHRWEANGGIWLSMFRGYDASSGRWLSEDPLPVTVRNPKELNSHAYVTSNPVRYTDPYGLALYGNWCGPGGGEYGEKAFDDIDQCCKQHDSAYGKCGASWRTRYNPFTKKNKKNCIKECDRRLCACLAQVVTDNEPDRKSKSQIMWFFKCGSSGSGGGR